ncbi:MAG: TonB-dependent receptor [Sulfuritalea sp.]|nr:TonB-dependent receptor [Sulfuritalea sp.]
MIKSSSFAVFTACSIFSTPLFATDDLAAIVVTATRQASRANDLLSDITVIGREEIERAPQDNLGSLIAAQPGVQQTANGSLGAASQILLRGANSSHTLVLIDGQRVGSATLGSFSWSRLPLAQIERIEILRGPASSLYGSDAIGGVVQIITRRGDGAPRLVAEAGAGSHGTSSANGSVTGSMGNLHYNLGATTLLTDGFNSLKNPANSSYNPDADGFSLESVNAALSFDAAPGHEVGFSTFHSDGRNRYDGGSSVATRVRQYENALTVQNHSIYLKNSITSDWNSTLRMGRSADDSTNYRDAAMTDIFRTDQNQITWQNDIRLPIGKLLVAWESLKQDVSGTTNYPTKERRTRSWIAGWNGKLGNHRLQTSLRRDNSSQFGAKTTGNLGWGYQFTEQWRANASYGTAFKAPSFNDLYYPLNFGYVGNPNLRPELAKSREVGVHYEAGSRRASAVWYMNKIDDLISWSGVTSPVNVGKARLEGLTLTYINQYRHFDYDATFDYLDAKNATDGKQLGRRARHSARFGLGQTRGDWQWRSEIQAVSSRFDDDANLKHLGGYSLVNLQASRALTDNWTVFARANNIFGKKYEIVADFATGGATAFVGLRYAPR